MQTAAGYAPAIGWYRKDFVLPSSSAADAWAVRFESVSNVATIWLNGHLIATHDGAFLPFEVALPAADLSRSGSIACRPRQRRTLAHRPAAAD